MKYGLIGALIPKIMDDIVYPYTKGALSDLDMKEFKKKHRAEYKAMVERTPGIGGMKENMLCTTAFIACYGFAYYKATPDKITNEIFGGMIDAVCTSDKMVKAYKDKGAFALKLMEKYKRGAERSQKGEYPMDWKFEFSFHPDVPEYYLTYNECGVCKIARQEHLEFLVPYMWDMDYKMIELRGGILIRTKTIGNGDVCCNNHVVAHL